MRFLNVMPLSGIIDVSTEAVLNLNNKPPIRILSPGRVYRKEDISVRSYCLFHQIEGLYVDKNNLGCVGT